eukprot:293143_1
MPRDIIDVWAQPPVNSLLENLPEVEQLFRKSKSPVFKWRKQYNGDPPISVTVNEMNEGGVDKLMLCGWNRPNKVLISNETILKYTQSYPDRFIGIVSVDLTSPAKACKDIDYYVKKHNFGGVRVVPWLWNCPVTTNYYYPLFTKCVELDIPFCTQVGHTGPLCPSEVGRPIPYIDRVALDFPQLKIICGHIGYPWTEEMIAVAWKHKNVYIDTSAHSPEYYPKNLLNFMNSYGRKKVMFGTNYPQLTFKRCVDQCKKLPIKKNSLQLFLSDNARRVFKLEKSKNSVVDSKL